MSESDQKMSGKLTKLSNLFFQTLREDPADAEVKSHKLLVRASYIRQVAPGIFSWLPLGLMVLEKIEKIIHEEMQKIGCNLMHFPALLPREPFEKTNRWNEYGNNIFRLKDRRNNDYLLAPTHEEMFTLIVQEITNSYRDFPLALYQIQTKYRDEARPRAGLLRGREFIMKDAYSFDLDDEGLEKSYQLQRIAYQNIFNRLGLDFTIVKATSGAMGGSASEEFLSPTPIGEDTFVVAPSGYAANVEAAEILVPDDMNEDEIKKLAKMEKVSTPNASSISDVSALMKCKPENMLKAVYLTLVHPEEDGKTRREVIVCFIRGDRDLDEKRAEALFAPCEVEQSTPEDLKLNPALVPGFVGPCFQNAKSPVRVFFDSAVYSGSAWVVGGNEKDVHFASAVAGRDFSLTDEDGNSLKRGLIEVRQGDAAADGSGELKIERGVEIGHIFALGQKYTKSFALSVLDQSGRPVVPTMGSYGIGVTRALALLAENHSDEAGLAWPKEIAPADLHIVVASKEESAIQAALDFATEVTKLGKDVFVDDRPMSPGVKFKDAELLGVPRIAVFGRGLNETEPQIEIKNRDGSDLKTVKLADAISAI